MFRAACKFSYSFFSGVVVALPIYVTVNDYICSVAYVNGSSMQPTLNPKGEKRTDVVFLDRWHVDYDDVNPGDVVAITSPNDRNVSFIKRIIGVEGDFVRTPRYKHDYAFIPRGHCWIEGDNSKSSLDSNSFGPVSVGLIKAKATHIIWPPSRWKRLECDIPSSRMPVDWGEHVKKQKKKKKSDSDDSETKLNIFLDIDNVTKLINNAELEKDEIDVEIDKDIS